MTFRSNRNSDGPVLALRGIGGIGGPLQGDPVPIPAGCSLVLLRGACATGTLVIETSIDGAASFSSLETVVIDDERFTGGEFAPPAGITHLRLRLVGSSSGPTWAHLLFIFL